MSEHCIRIHFKMHPALAVCAFQIEGMLFCLLDDLHVRNQLVTINQMVNHTLPPAQLNLVFHALSDPTRRDMVQQLAGGECTISELAVPFVMSMPAITKHVNVLVDAGLVSKRRAGKFTHCQLQTENLVAANDWIDLQRQYWESQLDSFAEYLQKQKTEVSKSKTSVPNVSKTKKRKSKK